ncbi:MAG: NAD(P)/FAD-dependent oxidoreductase [Gemmatimonadota bacterium]
MAPVSAAVETFDIAIVGGGPAGLAAASAAARLNRRVVCFETGTPRTAHAPRYHNYLGFPDGLPGAELLRLGREQVEKWGVVFRDERVEAIEPLGEPGPDRFALQTTAGAVTCGGVVLATGIKDRQPTCGDLYAKTWAGVHYCVVCDGFEVRDARVAVIGHGEGAYEMLCLLHEFTPDLHLLLDGEPNAMPAAGQAELAKWGVAVVADQLTAYSCEDGAQQLTFADGAARVYPHIFVALGADPNTDLARALGCALDENGYIETDACQATSVPFVYSAGDCDGGHKQVTQALAEGERAALELVKRLRQIGDPVPGAGAPRPS